MAPNSCIFLTRHGEAEHNVDEDYSIHDPCLTELGKEQASSAAPLIQDLQQSVDLIATSALRRTLQTTLRIWGPAIERLGIENVICLPEAQECLDYPCDTGSSKEQLEQDQEFALLNLARLTPDWNKKQGFYAPDPESVAQRTKWVRHFLRDRPEKNIVLVGHGDFLRNLTADANGSSTYMWAQAEIQLHKFDEATVDKDQCFLKLEQKVDTTSKAKAKT